MSRPNVTDEVIEGLSFACACVLDRRAASHLRQDYRWDERYALALAAINAIVDAHKRAVKTKTRKGR